MLMVVHPYALGPVNPCRMCPPDVLYELAATPYDNLLRVLRLQGHVLTEVGEDVVRFEGRNLVGAFAPPHAPDERFANRVLADHAEAFNKWSQVPVNLTLPSSQEALERLLAAFTWAGSPEGYRASNGFDFAAWVRDP